MIDKGLARILRGVGPPEPTTVWFVAAAIFVLVGAIVGWFGDGKVGSDPNERMRGTVTNIEKHVNELHYMSRPHSHTSGPGAK